MTVPMLEFREANRADLEAIIGMLADDPVARERESFQLPLPQSYVDAFEAITISPNTVILVADNGEEVVAVLQITFTPHLTHGGSGRATIEGVRVAAPVRGKGIGQSLVQRAIALAEDRGCTLVQLTTDNRRDDAKRFYEKLGFAATHTGLKLRLPQH